MAGQLRRGAAFGVVWRGDPAQQQMSLLWGQTLSLREGVLRHQHLPFEWLSKQTTNPKSMRVQCVQCGVCVCGVQCVCVV
jgi:hypothetical protein